MILPREVSYRSGRQQNRFEIAGGRAEFDKEEFADTPSPGTVLKASVIEVSYSDNGPSGLSWLRFLPSGRVGAPCSSLQT